MSTSSHNSGQSQHSLFPSSTQTLTSGSSPRDETQTKKWVVLHNDIVLARVDWDIHMNRIFAMLVSQISMDDEEFTLQRIRVKDLVDLAQIKREGIHSDIADAAQRLVREPFEFRTEDHHYEGYPIFSVCKYVRGEGCVEAHFNEKARPYLLKLSECFTRYRLRQVMKLSTAYAVRFYQIAKMIERSEGARRQTMDIPFFRELFLIEEKYDRYSDVVRFVIEPSVKEVNEKTDTNLRCRTIRKGGSKYGKPLELEWTVWPSDKSEPKGSVPRTDQLQLDPPSTAGHDEAKDSFEVWFEQQPEERRAELTRTAERLVREDVAGREIGERAVEARVQMKLREITKEMRQR